MKHNAARLRLGSSLQNVPPPDFARGIATAKPPWQPSLSAKIDPRQHFCQEDLVSTYGCLGCGQGFVLATGIVFRTNASLNGKPFSGFATFCSGVCLLNTLPAKAMGQA